MDEPKKGETLHCAIHNGGVNQLGTRGRKLCMVQQTQVRLRVVGGHTDLQFERARGDRVGESIVRDLKVSSAF